MKNIYKLPYSLKNMKRLTIFAVVFLAVLLSGMMIGSAAPCPPVSQDIISLSSTINGHAAPDNEPLYAVKIKYSTIFPGQTYSIADDSNGCNPARCTGTNGVVSIYSSINSHVSAYNSASPVPLGICYGDMVCAIRAGSCISPETEIASLSGASNAHISSIA